MRVLLFNTFYYPYGKGGAEKSVQLLAENIHKMGNIDISVAATLDKDRYEEINGVRVHFLKIPNLHWVGRHKQYSKPRRLLWNLLDSYNKIAEKKIKKLILKEKPDIIHTNNLGNFSVIVWALAAKIGIPVLHTIRGYYALCWRSTKYKNNQNCAKQCLDCRILSVFKKRLSHKIQAVTGISEFMLKEHLRNGYFSEAKIKKVIYNPVVSPDSSKPPSGEKPVFGFVGRLVSLKGIGVLLDIFAKIPEIKLNVFGSGYDEKYINLLKSKYKHENISFKGFKSTEEIYNAVDVLIAPSLWNEPFGRVIIEANSYGVIALASNRGAFPEIIKEGRTGFIYDADKVGELKKKILYCVDNFNKIKKLRVECIQHASCFRPEIIAREYVEIYKKLAI